MLGAMPEQPDLYRVLQVDPAANALVIQAAYRVLARIFHPDADGDDEQMKRINEAWGVLGDAVRRAQYDAERAGRHRGVTDTATSPAQPTTVPRARDDDHAGPPRGEPFGPVLRLGRYEGWTIGQVVRVDRAWLEWLRNVPAGRGLKADIDAVLGVRRGPGAVDERRHYETNQAKVHSWAPGAPTKVR
jgi:curved DNA-binding protein CbpA